MSSRVFGRWQPRLSTSARGSAGKAWVAGRSGSAAEVGRDVVGDAAGVLAGVGADPDCPEMPVQQVRAVGRAGLPHRHDRAGGDVADRQVLADPATPVAVVADPGGPARAVGAGMREVVV